MPKAINYPGVYIEEDASLSLSITVGATAVPIFAFGPANGEGANLDGTWPVRMNSWLDFIKFRRESDGTGQEFNSNNTLDVALKAYFENGGGYCYIAPSDKFTEVVPKLDDVTLLVAAGQNIKTAVDTLCVPGSRLFAILDGKDIPLPGAYNDAVFDGYDSSSHAAAYYPWLKADWAQIKIPPSAAVAGAMCRVDRERGVWKAPANVPLNGGLKVTYQISDDIQGAYTDSSKMALNIIREFSGVGTVIWGARTLATTDTDKWRYIPVRRLFDSVERDIKKAIRFAIFEPNSQPTWERVRAAIDNYLHALWRQGGLMGNTSQEAYFVQIGKGVTMTEEDVKQGKMIVKIGMAAIRPAEFIILQFTQEVGQV